MKIGIIAHLKHPIKEPFLGGLEMHTHVLARKLQEKGHQVDLFALEGSDERFNVMPLELGKINMNDTTDVFEDHPDFNQHFMNIHHAYMNVVLRAIDSDYDIIHNNSLHYLPPSLAHLSKCPFVTTLHTPPFPSLQSGVLTGSKYKGGTFVSVSDSLGKQWSPFVKDYTTVYNGVDIKQWTFSAEAEEKQAVWVGRFCPEKGPHLAIEAAKKAGFKLNLIGAIYDKKYYTESIVPLLDDHIQHLGHMNHQEISREIGKAQVALFSSLWDEPFGLVLTEYLACGTPVVAFDSGAACEIVNHHCGFIVPKGDTGAMAAAMQRSHVVNRKACRTHIIRHFKVDRMIDDYEGLYYQLLRQRSTSEATVIPMENKKSTYEKATSYRAVRTSSR